MARFHIKHSVPTHKCRTDDQLNDEVTGLAKRYHQIDLMVFLCEGWKYEAVYGELAPSIARLIERFGALPVTGDDAFPDEVKGQRINIVSALRSMANLVDDINQAIADDNTPAKLVNARMNHPVFGDDPSRPLELREFFETRFLPVDGDEDLLGKVAQLWVSIRDLLPDYLCFPWADIQEDENEVPVPADTMTDHIRDLRHYELKELYTIPKKHNPALRQAIVDGRANGVLSRVTLGSGLMANPPAREPASDVRPLTTPGKNDHKCVVVGQTTECQPYQNEFCNESDDGTCSVSS